MAARAGEVIDVAFEGALADLLVAIYPDSIPRDHYPRLIRFMKAACHLTDSSGYHKASSPAIETPAPKPKVQSPKSKMGRPTGLPRDSDLIPEIVSKREAGASIREIHRWLCEKGIRVSYNTVDTRLKEALQKGEAPQDEYIEPPVPKNDAVEELHDIGEGGEGETISTASSRTDELRRLALELGLKRAVDPQAPARGREIRRAYMIYVTFRIGSDGLDLSDVEAGGEYAD